VKLYHTWSDQGKGSRYYAALPFRRWKLETTGRTDCSGPRGVRSVSEIPSEVSRFTDASISTIHHTLQASRRRLVVGLVSHRVLWSNPRGHSGTELQEPSSVSSVSVRRLAKEIVAVEEGVPTKHATGDEYHNVYTALIQTHLPKLDRAGAIEYDEDRKIVTPDRNLPALAIAAAILSPVAQTLFHSAVADLYTGETSSLSNSITD